MTHYINLLFSTSNFEPHSTHFLPGNIPLMWLLIIGNALIAILYFVMPFFLLYIFVKRPDFPFRYVFFAIPLFGFACSVTHIVMIISFWYPLYYLQGVVDLICGIISFGTFLVFAPTCYKALYLKGPDILRSENEKLQDKIHSHRNDKARLAQKNLELKHINEIIQRKNEEISKLNKKMINQELYMVELKESINALKQKSYEKK